MDFLIVLAFVLIIRAVELVIARWNENVLFAQGAYEVGASQYPYIIVLRVGFWLSLWIQVMYDQAFAITHLWLLILFLLVQLLRTWSIVSLGQFWSTKIIVLKGSEAVVKGPYRYVRHPIDAAICLEILLLSAMFGAYFTAILFLILNMWMMAVRISLEEEALQYATNYADNTNKND